LLAWDWKFQTFNKIFTGRYIVVIVYSSNIVNNMIENSPYRELRHRLNHRSPDWTFRLFSISYFLCWRQEMGNKKMEIREIIFFHTKHRQRKKINTHKNVNIRNINTQIQTENTNTSTNRKRKHTRKRKKK
jgi:hypothetical protein